MRKIFPVLVCTIFMLQTSFAQGLSKEEKKRLKDELKGYEKDLEGYKAKMQDIRTTLDSNDAEIKRLKDDFAYSSTKQAELENKVADYDHEVSRLQTENNVLKGYAPDGNDSTLVNKQTGGVSTAIITNAAQKGTVYKVQIGLYKEFNINKYFEAPRFIGYEDVDGLNRYIISYFPDEEIAKDFVKDVRKMGIKDAFVSKYIDGQRVYEWSKNPKYAGKKEPASLQEALEADKAKGKKKE